MKPNEWLPVRWASGPLEAAVRKDVTREESEALSAWHRPESLGHLDGSPFNCIVVNFGAGRPEDSEQQRTLKPLIDAAKKKNFAVVGEVAGPAGNYVHTAQSAGLDALLAEKAGAAGGFTIIGAYGPAETGKAPGPVAAVSGCEWPSVRLGRGGNAESGPTGYPWVDANGWSSLLARAQAPDKTIWTTPRPKRNTGPVRPEVYALAVADSAAYGSRWLVSLDAITQAGLTAGDSAAREAWSTLVKSVRFFEDHRALTTGETLARLGIVSDFEGPNEFLGQEVLNLSVRRQLPSRILHPARLKDTSLQGLKAVLFINEKAPADAAKSHLDRFLQTGGMLIVPASAAHMTDGHPSAGTHDTGYKLFTAGKGRIAVSPEPWSDPYQVAADAHRLLSRRYDVIRLWNAGSSITHPVTGNGRTAVHVLNYTGRPFGQPMSLYVAEPWAHARFSDLFGRSEALPVTRKNEGSEVSLPVFTTYAAIEFGGKA